MKWNQTNKIVFGNENGEEIFFWSSIVKYSEENGGNQQH